MFNCILDVNEKVVCVDSLASMNLRGSSCHNIKCYAKIYVPTFVCSVLFVVERHRMPELSSLKYLVHI